MANTEGLSDEALSSLLAMPSPEEEEQQRRPHRDGAARAGGETKPKATATGAFPRQALSRREQMVELGEGEMPAATVVRSSKPPIIYASSSSKKRQGMTNIVESNNHDQQLSPHIVEEANISGRDGLGEATDESPTSTATAPRRVFLSECIRERPAAGIGANGVASASSTTKRESRFKQRNRDKKLGAPTAGGFPSLDIAPVGAFTRNGRSARVQNPPDARRGTIPRNPPKTDAPTRESGNDVGATSDSMLANMSLDEIRDGVEEVQSILSAESIEFLRRRGRQKQTKQKGLGSKGPSAPQKQAMSLRPDVTLPKEKDIEQEEKKEREGKEKMAELLSSVRTPDDMDRVYKEALQLGLAPELPSSALDTAEAKLDGDDSDVRMKNLHTATSLLRSTAPRQRLLGARSLCHILEEDTTELDTKRRVHSFSDTIDDREALRQMYPQHLPVALRCLLDESIATFQTAGGRLLLSLTLRCIHSLMSLFVHPYHVVNVNPDSDASSDPFILYQTCFMRDVSHAPPVTELYAPTQIQPIGEGDANNASCYRADSSAATAESDSKAFYTDPAWTLLSRMRILPCLSDIIRCLSADYSTGVTIPGETIQSVCGILAMLAVRSPGAAGAIARHKGILPFLASYCLSPSDGIRTKESGQSETKRNLDDDGLGLFDSGTATPALVLLCHLARQSRDIAELEMPFQAVISDLQAMLLVEAGCESEPQITMKIWSLILLRILFRYGLATDHIQSLIGIVAPRVELMQPKGRLDAHYLSLFANICEASKIAQQGVDDGRGMATIHEADDSLALSGMWLTAPVRASTSSFQAVVKGTGFNHMKLAAAQLRLVASFIATASSTRESTSIPIVSDEACCQVVEATLESKMLNQALTVALQPSFDASWRTPGDSDAQSLADEAIACSFVASFMSFVKVVGCEVLGSALVTKLRSIIIAHLDQLSKQSHPAATSAQSNLHPARKSWFVEAEFSVLSILCADSGQQHGQHLLPSFAFSLIGRLNVGHEALAAYLLKQEQLFQANKGAGQGQGLQTLFLSEITFDDHRQLQLKHSSDLHFMRGPLSSFRCTADHVGRSNSRERFFLPLGPIWMWNVLSSTTSQPDRPQIPGDDHDQRLVEILSHTLSILLQLENESNGSFYAGTINDGTKLYHLANVCLFPETILSDDFIRSALDQLFKQFTGCSHDESRLTLVHDFIKACFEHSRLSKESKKHGKGGTGDAEKQLQALFNPMQPSSDSTYSTDELKALDDFVDDLCDSYIEYGGQYSSCTHFIRFLLGHGFPTTVTTTVLTKLHPILHLLTIEDEERDELHSSLTQSISGGLPSLDSSRRDPSNILDSFALSLKKRDKELMRNDYAYLLAVVTLSRNFASSSQRCECGLAAMKIRLLGVSDGIFYDTVQVAVQFLRSDGTKNSLVDCVIDICMNERALEAQDTETKRELQWNSSDAAVWETVVTSLKSAT